MEHHKTVPTDGNCHKSKRLCARRRFDGSFAPRERTGESPLAFGARFWAPKWPHGDPNRQSHRTHDWFCDRKPVAKPHAARSRRTLKGKNRQNPFADSLLQKSPEVCAVRTAPEPPHHGPAVAQNAQHLGAPLGAPFDVVLLLFPICYTTQRSRATVQLSAHNCRLRITKMLRSKTAVPLFKPKFEQGLRSNRRDAGIRRGTPPGTPSQTPPAQRAAAHSRDARSLARPKG